MKGTSDRFEGEVDVEGRRYRATVAWRGVESGYGVLYFWPSDDAKDDRGDRRALLTPGVDARVLGEEALRALYEAGRPLTETERRFGAADGRQWLARSRGPVWAGRPGVEGGGGILFTSLEGEPEWLQGPGGHVGEMSAEELSSVWRRALRGGSTGEDERSAEASEADAGTEGGERS